MRTKFTPLCLTLCVLLPVLLHSQTELSSIPLANSDNTIHVCQGSTILFANSTPATELSGNTSFLWSFGVGSDAITAGPHAITYATPGIYEVELTIVTFDGESNLGSSSLTVEVGGVPPIIPTIGIGNPCTVMFDSQTPIVFQTQNGGASCTCPNQIVGPAISIMDTDQYPTGTVSQIWWGGAGYISNGGMSPYTEQSSGTGTSFPTSQSSLSVFNGQNEFGHYSSQGSYNMVHVVQFPNGSVYSNNYVMSWGAPLIDFSSNAAQFVCSPLGYELVFGSQSPGTTYTIDWGDDATSVFTYPNLPVSPNGVGHAYNPSCQDLGYAEGYEITVVATNACPIDTTENVQGPLYVSTPPQADFVAWPGLAISQFESIQFTEAIDAGFQASGGSCADEHIWAWSINGSSNAAGFGYEVTVGQMGDVVDIFNIYSGSEAIMVAFELPGIYEITLTVSSDFCIPMSLTQTVQVNGGGCNNEFACNYNPNATEDDGSCDYESCAGCMDEGACDFDPEATLEDGTCDYESCAGCMYEFACNYDPESSVDDGSCDYCFCLEGTQWSNSLQGCEVTEAALAMACGDGTYWDDEAQACLTIVTCSQDLDGDGTIGVEDLMQLLSLFGTDCEAEDVDPELGEFTCGGLMNYHGYDYATVLIGEQCWFAENLRTSFYLNGDSVAIVEGNSDWLALANDDSGAMAAYENTDENSSVFGFLYNGYAVLDNRKLCPLNWKVPSDSDWQDLELNLGMSTSELSSESWRGASENIGTRLKVDAANSPSWNGSNTTLWSGLPAGYRHPEGGYNSLGSITLFWSQGLVDGANPLYDYLFARQLKTTQAGIKREREMALRGYSVRCLKDTE